jgi:hypothetical protein
VLAPIALAAVFCAVSGGHAPSLITAAALDVAIGSLVTTAVPHAGVGVDLACSTTAAAADTVPALIGSRRDDAGLGRRSLCVCVCVCVRVCVCVLKCVKVCLRARVSV